MWFHGSKYVCKVSIRIVFLKEEFTVYHSIVCRSIFGEDALANLSIEKPLDRVDAPVTGHIRIRAKSQVRISLIIIHRTLNKSFFTFSREWRLV